jgi:hypothetical protein
VGLSEATVVSLGVALVRPGGPAIIASMRVTKRWSSADLDAAIERITPGILELLGHGVPRAKAAIVTALTNRHPKDEVTLTLMRLDVLGRLVEKGGRYALPALGSAQS